MKRRKKNEEIVETKQYFDAWGTVRDELKELAKRDTKNYIAVKVCKEILLKRDYQNQTPQKILEDADEGNMHKMNE